MQLLLIKLNSLSSSPEYATIGKKQAEDRFTPSDWSKVRSLTRGRKVLLLIPNSDAVLTTSNVPSKNKKQLMQAVPFALEDTLAEDIDDLHFAIHQEVSEGLSNVAIINKDVLDNYIDLLKQNGLTVHFILPQILAQAHPKNGWSILQKNGSIDVRLDAFNGFNCDENLLELFLADKMESLGEDNTLDIIYSNIEAEELPAILQDLSIEKTDARLTQYSSVEPALALNLITGFVSHKQESKIDWKAWRPTLVLASLVAAIGLGILSWQNNGLKTQSKQLNLAIEKTFKSAFPESRIVDPPQQMTSKLAQLKKNVGKTSDSPLPIIANISPLVKEFKDLTLKEVRYQDDALELVMSSPNLTRLETFKKDAAKKAKLKVEIKSSTTTANKVEAILLISPLTESAASADQQSQLKGESS